MRRAILGEDMNEVGTILIGNRKIVIGASSIASYLHAYFVFEFGLLLEQES